MSRRIPAPGAWADTYAAVADYYADADRELDQAPTARELEADEHEAGARR